MPGAGHDWLRAFRVWDGGLGMPGAIAAGAVGAWLACRRAGVRLAPAAGAAAPGLAFGLALGCRGNWFTQQLYAPPSGLPWAVGIAPVHRVPGYENYATFQPTFLYQCGWDMLTGLVVIWAARRFLLTGDRALAFWLALYALGGDAVESLRIDAAHYLFGLRVNQWVLALLSAGSLGYLYRTRHKRGPERVAGVPPGPANPGGARRLRTLAGRAGMHR
jgi:prolipoprotein diacylglyceryltransferase